MGLEVKVQKNGRKPSKRQRRFNVSYGKQHLYLTNQSPSWGFSSKLSWRVLSTRKMFMQKAYQDNRAGRYIGMTVSYIMKGLSISRRTVKRSLTLLETRGYFRCEVARGDQSRMCIGLIVHLLTPLFTKHQKEK